MSSLLRPPALCRLTGARHMRSVSVRASEESCSSSSPLFLSFEDPRAFRVKSMWELVRALTVFRLCSAPVLVNNCAQ
ncbi:hypothetical protein DNTS_013545, partial [Danionella cerebrum]